MLGRESDEIKILFIALAQSTHTHAWIELLKDWEFDVRLFGIGHTSAPREFGFPTYSMERTWPSLKPDRKIAFKGKQIARYGAGLVLGPDSIGAEEGWLARVINKWSPDIIHTLGLEPASFSFLRVKEELGAGKDAKWVVTARGGPELALNRLIEEEADKIKGVLEGCDSFIADNKENYQYALELGLDPSKISSLGPVPGTGGVDVKELSGISATPPSKRERLILWPKAYECPASKALPVFEALRLCWERIKPCEIFMSASIPETRMWFETLPEEIKKSCHIEERIPRNELLGIMARSRVVLAPSLIDGVPNTLYEAMATGALPILSPLETFSDIVRDGENVLLARNLYPQEIASALARAMSDDLLVDSAAEINREMVARIADREMVAERVAAFYDSL